MRKTKYTKDTIDKLLMYIKDGRTVRDSCKLIGITEMTLCRWRRRYPKFDQKYLDAIKRQQAGLEALKKCGVRTYRRSITKLELGTIKRVRQEKINQEKQQSKKSGRLLVYDGLRIRYGNIVDDHPMEPCICYYNGRVEYLKRKGRNLVHYAIQLELFKRKNPTWYRQLVEQNKPLAEV